MKSRHTAALMLAMLAADVAIGRSQGQGAYWLDEAKPRSWNSPNLPIPAAPKAQGPADDRCRQQARPPELKEDARVQDQGWDLVGPYLGGWLMLVIRGTASYDGMCRPLQYQDFVFVRGVFAGTLSPQPMDSRADGALGQVFVQSDSQLTAEYSRYEESDALCCPSRTTRVVFDIPEDPPIVRPASASTSEAEWAALGDRESSRSLEGAYWKAVELTGTPIAAQDPAREVYLQFRAGRVSGFDGCNRIVGSYQLNGDRVTFGQLAGTRMACLDSSGIEARVQDALSKAQRLSIVGDRLELFDAAGTPVAAFVHSR
jgi:heat shock protein HslJ